MNEVNVGLETLFEPKHCKPDTANTLTIASNIAQEILLNRFATALSYGLYVMAFN